jgi:hypothetical protein
MQAYTEMFQHVGSYLHAAEEVQPPPLHTQLGDAWWNAVSKEWSIYGKEVDLTEETLKQARDVMECFQIGYTCLAAHANQKEQDEVQAQIQSLLLKPQSVQRTEEWYKEMKEVLSASEFYKLFGSPRTRGQLVLSKVLPDATATAVPEESSLSQRKCCLTVEMTPFDWGIRFEPIAKQILEAKWKAKIAEMGRLHHPIRKGLAASPDGLICEAESIDLIGDLVEIKCPSSRVIGNYIVSDYWYQMQLQLEVTGSHICQFSEFCFRSYTAQKPETVEAPANPIEKGVLYIIQNEAQMELKYLYGPLGSLDWEPTLETGWEILERVPWYLEKLSIQPVARDEVWFQSILPLINAFWQDVEKARKGEFALPESTTKKKVAVCAIID